MKVKDAIARPVILTAAFAATWGGWVELGRKAGYGDVNLLPGFVADGGWATRDLTLALPLGVDVYGAYAVSVAFDQDQPRGARWFGGITGAGAFAAGAVAQAIVHNLDAGHVAVASPVVVTFVAVLPVVIIFAMVVLAMLSGRDVPEVSEVRTTFAGQLTKQLATAGVDNLVRRMSGTGTDARADTPDDRKPDVADTVRPARTRVLMERAELAERVRELLNQDPRPSIRDMAGRLAVPKTTVGEIVKELNGTAPSLNGHK